MMNINMTVVIVTAIICLTLVMLSRSTPRRKD